MTALSSSHFIVTFLGRGLKQCFLRLCNGMEKELIILKWINTENYICVDQKIQIKKGEINIPSNL